MNYESLSLLYAAVIPWLAAACMMDEEGDNSEKLLFAAPYLFGLSAAGICLIAIGLVKEAK